jgi:transcriptional regulator with XRE-family HTH domain
MLKKPEYKFIRIGKPDKVANGAAARRYRLARGVAGNAVAREMRFDPSTISYYEHGKRSMTMAIFSEYLEAVDTIADWLQKQG